nr:response regulator [Gemmatimonadales bacterium]
MSAPAPQLPPTVLLVDDEELLRRALARALENRGYRVVTAEDGAAAWTLLQAGAGGIDAVVTDVTMPNMDGWELAARVATLPQAPPVILVSGQPQDVSTLGRPFLPKPFHPDELASVL